MLLFQERLYVALSAVVWLTWWCSATDWPRWSQRIFQLKLTVLHASFFVAETPQSGALSGCLQGRCEICIVFSRFLACLLCLGIRPLGAVQGHVGSWFCRAKGAEWFICP